MSSPLLLDLFCGAGGCTAGYRRAGFDVYAGVDDKPHPTYPGELYVADALDVLAELVATGEAFGRRPDVVHASPPCPRHSAITPDREDHPDLIPPVLELLQEWGGLYVIENVMGAPLPGALMLCGSEFGLGAVCSDGRYRYLERHRLFQSNVFLMGAGGCQHGMRQALGVYGDGGGGASSRPSGGGGYKAFADEGRAAMDIDWMNRDDLSDAIPPAYTEFIGDQLLVHLAREAAA